MSKKYYGYVFKEKYSDYSFQNSTDRPKEISEIEYKGKERIWDDLLYSTYRPRREGLSFELTANEMLSGIDFTAGNFEKLKKSEKIEIPSEGEIVCMLAASFVDYPSEECNEPDFDWFQYIKASEYKEWRKFNIERTKQNLTMFSFDEIKQLISTNI